MEQGKTFNSIRIPMPLIPVYATLTIQLLGVVFMSGVIWTKLNTTADSIEKLNAKIDTVVVMELKELRKDHNQLEFRVRHFQAQFPEKTISP